MNKVILMGRPTADPEIRYSQKEDGSQAAIANFTLAVDRKGKDAGTDFIRCVAFGKNGEFAEKYVTKGRKYAIAGRIQTGSYTNKDGQKVYTTDIVVEEFDFCDSKGDSKPAADEQAPPAQDTGFIDIPDGIENDLPFK